MQAHDDLPETTSSDPDTAELPLAHEALGDVMAAARSYATKERLWAKGGGLHCWNCSKPTPWHVSLHCEPCRQACIRRAQAAARAERRLPDEEHRWRGMTWAMAEESRMTAELAFTLLTEARKLPSATPERMELLTQVHDQRFAAVQKPEQKQKYRYEQDR